MAAPQPREPTQPSPGARRLARRGPPQARPRRLLAGAGWQVRARLTSGLVLFLFAATHLLNHAVGLVSLEALEAARSVFLGFWRFLPVEILLGVALVTHIACGIAALWLRRSLRLPAVEWLQLALGLAIPFWLAAHVAVTGVASRVVGFRDTYAYYLSGAWPGDGWGLTILVTLVWLHGCIGVHRWLRLRSGYRRWQPALAALAVALPLLSLLGFVEAGRFVAAVKLADPAWQASAAAAGGWPGAELRRSFAESADYFVVTPYAWLLAAVATVLALRWIAGRWRSGVAVQFDGGQPVRGNRGMTLLEMARSAGLPHASVCGGRGRCSTCRVRILTGGESVPPPGPGEQRVLERIHAGPDVRLACQLRPRHALKVARLVAPGDSARAVLQPMDPAQGREAEIAILFADLRGFTQLSERRLPYDTVFLLNRYFATMGAVIEAAGGQVDKFVGDGVMALFGLAAPPRIAARQALQAVREMSRRLDELNDELGHDLPAPLRIGIGLHVGRVIVGELGYGRATSITAIGDPVNVASRLETLAKELDVELVASARTIEAAGLSTADFSLRPIEVRGRTASMDVIALPRAADLPVLLVSPTEPPPFARRLGLSWRRVRGLVRAA